MFHIFEEPKNGGPAQSAKLSLETVPLGIAFVRRRRRPTVANHGSQEPQHHVNLFLVRASTVYVLAMPLLAPELHEGPEWGN